VWEDARLVAAAIACDAVMLDDAVRSLPDRAHAVAGGVWAALLGTVGRIHADSTLPELARAQQILDQPPQLLSNRVCGCGAAVMVSSAAERQGPDISPKFKNLKIPFE
jgi:hypothetical protein